MRHWRLVLDFDEGDRVYDCGCQRRPYLASISMATTYYSFAQWRLHEPSWHESVALGQFAKDVCKCGEWLQSDGMKYETDGSIGEPQ